jgi:subtilase family serine protease
MKILFAFLFMLCFLKPNKTPQLEFTIALKTRNTELLQTALEVVSNPNSSNYGEYYSKEWIKKVVSPSILEMIPVFNWLNTNNIKVLNNNGDSLLCKGKIRDIEKLLNVTMKKYKHYYNGKYMYRSHKDYTIPKKLNKIVLFVEGISNKLIEKHSIYSHNYWNDEPPVSDNNYAGKEIIYRLYNVTLPKSTMGSVSLASIEYQGNSGFSQSDLSLSEFKNGAKNNTVQNIVGTDTGTDLESQLDIQMMGINAPNTTLWFWDDNNWLFSLASKMSNAKKIPDIISMSWGWSETDQCSITQCNNETAKQYVDRVNIEYIKLGLRGVTITVASGDAGAPGRTNEDCMNNSNTVHAVFPGSSPWVTSVGATFIQQSNQSLNYTTSLCKEFQCANGTLEYVTNHNSTGWTSGGGISNFSHRSFIAKWQDELVTNYLKSGIPLPKNFNTNGRAYPDVSVIGHSCPVFNNGVLQALDGTSCSSPVFASLVALLNQHQLSQGKPKLGFINPILYQMAKDNPLIFNDQEDGNNWSTEWNVCPVRKDGGSDFGYKATKGYDPVYGLGTPNIGLMIEWLNNHT